MEYLTFELEIGKSKDHEYEVRVLHSPAGEPRATMTSFFKKTELEQGLLALRTALLRSADESGRVATCPSEQTSLRELGQVLFKALIAGDIRVCYERSLDIAEREGKGLRVQLRIVAAEMATLPWEYMYDPDQGVYLGRSSQTPIVRYLELGQAVETVTIRPPLRILGMVANPEGTERLNLQRERRRLEEAVDLLQQRGLLEITWVSGETWEDLKRMIQKGPWHIFHFIGHGGFGATQGEGEGYVLLSDEQDKKHPLTATGLADLLTADRQQRPRLVVLNACKGAQSSEQDIFSSTASILVRRGIPAVAAMQYAITDQAAIEFSKSFYTALISGQPIEAAIAEARLAIYMTGKDSVEWGTPVLYSHARDGVLFRMETFRSEEDSRQFSLDLNPQKERGWGEGRLTVEVRNQGNTDVTVQLEADAPEDICSYAFDLSQVTVSAGQKRNAQLTISTSKRPLCKAKVYPFTVTGRSIETPQLVRTVNGEWEQSPPIGLCLGFLALFTAILSYVMYSMAYYLFCLAYFDFAEFELRRFECDANKSYVNDVATGVMVLVWLFGFFLGVRLWRSVKRIKR